MYNYDFSAAITEQSKLCITLVGIRGHDGFLRNGFLVSIDPTKLLHVYKVLPRGL